MYDVFGSADMKEMVNVLFCVDKAGSTWARVLRCSTMYTLLQASFFQIREPRAITREYSGERRSESEESISVELGPEF